MKTMKYSVIGISLLIASCAQNGGSSQGDLLANLEEGAATGAVADAAADAIAGKATQQQADGAMRDSLPDVGACLATFACSDLRSNFLGSWMLTTPEQLPLPASAGDDEAREKPERDKKMKRPDLIYRATDGASKPQCSPYGVRKGFTCMLETGEELTCKKMHKKHHGKHMKRHHAKIDKQDRDANEGKKERADRQDRKHRKHGYACHKAISE
ncbi:MAG: hypothetical protein AAF310_05425 [Myxococcota bacterium]